MSNHFSFSGLGLNHWVRTQDAFLLQIPNWKPTKREQSQKCRQTTIDTQDNLSITKLSKVMKTMKPWKMNNNNGGLGDLKINEQKKSNLYRY